MMTTSSTALAQYFDIFHNESSNTSRNSHASTNNSNNQRNNSNNNYNDNASTSNPTSSSPRVKPDDVCPIHGSHKYHFCIFNEDGPNYRPPARSNTSTTTSAKKSNDNFNNEQTRHETNDDDNTSTNPYDDDFIPVAPPNEPVPQVITEGISATSRIAFSALEERNH